MWIKTTQAGLHSWCVQRSGKNQLSQLWWIYWLLLDLLFLLAPQLEDHRIMLDLTFSYSCVVWAFFAHFCCFFNLRCHPCCMWCIGITWKLIIAGTSITKNSLLDGEMLEKEYEADVMFKMGNLISFQCISFGRKIVILVKYKLNYIKYQVTSL